MKSVFEEKQDCCGCTACEHICPTNAIKMLADEEGFLYPDIIQELCIDCGLCKKVCPIQNKLGRDDRFDEPRVYAIKHKSNNVRMKSASGGAYPAISDYILKESNIVYGVKFSEKFYVHHDRAKNIQERDEFKGSKYIQSDLRDTFIRIKDDLIDGKGVLFTGTGCQVAGLINYLDAKKVNTDNLITNDIICHGTPSPLLWNEYLDFIQQKDELASYTFRDKDVGWHGYNVRVKYEKGKEKLNTPDIRIYANLFGSGLALRPSCYHCKFTNLKRPSDIMIGDFWGIERTLPEIDDNKGVSLMMINTNKGSKVFNEIKSDMEIWESNTKDCLQPNLIRPTRCPENREQFWQDYYDKGFKYIAKKYCGYGIKSRTKKILADILKKLGMYEWVKRIVKG